MGQWHLRLIRALSRTDPSPCFGLALLIGYVQKKIRAWASGTDGRVMIVQPKWFAKGLNGLQGSPTQPINARIIYIGSLSDKIQETPNRGPLRRKGAQYRSLVYCIYEQGERWSLNSKYTGLATQNQHRSRLMSEASQRLPAPGVV